jgi:hypothetical protein
MYRVAHHGTYFSSQLLSENKIKPRSKPQVFLGLVKLVFFINFTANVNG